MHTIGVARLFLAAAFLTLFASRTSADEVRLRNGRIIRGVVERRPNDEIVVHAATGDVRLDLAEVESILETHAATERTSARASSAPTPDPRSSVADTNVKRSSATVVDPLVRAEVDRLRSCLADRSADRKEEAAAALTALGRPAVPYLLDIYEHSVSPEVIWLTWVLRDIGDLRAVDAFVKRLPGSEAALQAALLDSLKRFHDPRAFDAAASLAASAKGEAKQRAFELVAQSGDPRATPILLRGLLDSNGWVREASEDALRATIDSGAGAALIDPLTREITFASDDVVESIVHLLSRIHDTRVVEPIAEVLDRENPRPRRIAVRSLAQLEDRRAAEPLTRALADEDALVRCEALRALARIRQREAFPLIVERLVDPESPVRVAARAALVNLAGVDKGTQREAWIRWWAQNGEL
ncbi:MAG: HEAT repeat domain-containing protein [Planctomycetes bacterium]|nr:HEAT repeat domain-containing protein [Planctomycetota bacterium]MBI3844098.1 HEAT repeat domain-containing protein [Planctomycetota bacterium]